MASTKNQRQLRLASQSSNLGKLVFRERSDAFEDRIVWLKTYSL